MGVCDNDDVDFDDNYGFDDDYGFDGDYYDCAIVRLTFFIFFLLHLLIFIFLFFYCNFLKIYPNTYHPFLNLHLKFPLIYIWRILLDQPQMNDLMHDFYQLKYDYDPFLYELHQHQHKQQKQELVHKLGGFCIITQNK